MILTGGYILNAENAREDIIRPFKLLFLEKESLIFLIAMVLSFFIFNDKPAKHSILAAICMLSGVVLTKI